MGRRLQLTLCMLLLVVSFIPIQAFGHTALLEMNPKQGSQLEQSPKQISLLFSEKLEVVTEKSLFVEDDRGNHIETGLAEIGNKGKSIQLTLPELAKGTYTVRYHVMSMDGHMVEGEYEFTVLTDQIQVPIEPDITPVGPEEQVKPEVPAEVSEPTEVTEDYGSIPVDLEQNERDPWTAVFTEIDMAEVLDMVYFIIFLILIGMMIWYVILRRDRSDMNAIRHRNWILQVQRVHLLVLIVVIVEFVQQSVGFKSWQLVKNMLLETTTGTSWSILFVLSCIGLGVLQRNRTVDLLWIIAVVAAMSQIGHAASSEHRFIASALIATHLLAAGLWAGGLLYLILLWRRYRHIAEKLILKLSNASLIAMAILTLSGMASSLLYLNHISYVLDTRWGHILLLKVAVVLVVIIVGAVIRRRYMKKGLLRVGAWMRLDFVMLLVIASLAALLTQVEPNPPNEPLHWHVMGQEVHMTAEITPNIPGEENRFAVHVWLPEDSGEPKSVAMLITHETDGEEQAVTLTKGNTSEDYGFEGFNEFVYEAESDQLNQAGIWFINIEVTDQQVNRWTYKKQIRVY